MKLATALIPMLLLLWPQQPPLRGRIEGRVTVPNYMDRIQQTAGHVMASEPIENDVETSVTFDASTRMARSLSISVPFDRIENGFRYSMSARMMPGISL